MLTKDLNLHYPLADRWLPWPHQDIHCDIHLQREGFREQVENEVLKVASRAQNLTKTAR